MLWLGEAVKTTARHPSKKNLRKVKKSVDKRKKRVYNCRNKTKQDNTITAAPERKRGRKREKTMLKLNSKTATAKADRYITARISAADALELVENFNAWQEGETKLLTFGEFMVDYDCALAIYYEEQRAALAEILEETPEEAARYSDTMVHSVYCSVMEKAFIRSFGYRKTTRRNRYNLFVPALEI